MISALIGFFTALPELVKLASEIFTFLKDTFGDNPQKFLKDAGTAFENLNNAQTPEDRTNAAFQIHDLIKRL